VLVAPRICQALHRAGRQQLHVTELSVAQRRRNARGQRALRPVAVARFVQLALRGGQALLLLGDPPFDGLSLVPGVSVSKLGIE
jgi:hypothetical protein